MTLELAKTFWFIFLRTSVEKNTCIGNCRHVFTQKRVSNWAILSPWTCVFKQKKSLQLSNFVTDSKAKFSIETNFCNCVRLISNFNFSLYGPYDKICKSNGMLESMAIRVVGFSIGGYKIRKIFAKELTYSKEIIEFWELG